MPPSLQTAEEGHRWQELWRALRPIFLFAEEQTEDQRSQVIFPRSNSRAETNTPGQSSLFGVPAIASKAARLGLVRRSCGRLTLRPLGENRKQIRKVVPQDQTLKEVCIWDATQSVLPEQLSNEKPTAILKARGRTGPQETDKRFLRSRGASQRRLSARPQLLTEMVSCTQRSV